MASRTWFLGGVIRRALCMGLCAGVAFGSVAALHAQQPAAAQAEEPSLATGPEEAEPSQELIDQIRSLVPSQQRAAALQIIEKYPKSEVAENARQLIVEFDAYVQQAAKDRLKDEARNRWVR
ncbi:MAG TPA: hypothetical protein VHB77_13590, partial [Planctomycetaceae bacterium]|nr:hypothetical protein [Planctomycetaceae bacterium]